MTPLLRSLRPETAGAAKQRWNVSQRDVLHGVFVGLNVLAFVLVQLEVPDPYLDEIFHIPQTQRYCDEDFDAWDPAITTPPGLYLLAAIPLMTVHVPCSPPILRLTNLYFTTLTIPALLSAILDTLPSPIAYPLRPAQRSPALASSQRPFWKHWVRPSAEALAISSLPLIAFFGNLFYTDVASLAGVLAAWAMALRKRHLLAIVLGASSMTVRQTNVIWLAFIMATSVLDEIRSEQLRRSAKKDGEDDHAVSALAGMDPHVGDVASFQQLSGAVAGQLRTAFRIQSRLLVILACYMPAFIGFAIFLKWNGGIVLGHKENHKPVVHAVQMLYFLAFSTALYLPALSSEGPLRTIAGALRTGLGSSRRALLSACAILGMLVIVKYTTIIHPFLLADNRHYVFYLFRWVIRPYPSARYLLCGGYLVAAWVWLYNLRHKTTLLWLLGFVACGAAVLIPTPLVEPRYYLIPMIILRVRLSPGTRPETTPQASIRREMNCGASVIQRQPPSPDRGIDLTLWAEYAFNTAINMATVGVFLTVRFRWEGWDGWMRFMW